MRTANGHSIRVLAFCRERFNDLLYYSPNQLRE